MREIEKAIVSMINEYHRRHIYHSEDYQMLKGVRYSKIMSGENLKMLRDNYSNNCFEAAYELKSYYAQNDILSNTIVLKMRPSSPEIQGFFFLKIHSDLDGADHEYTHHAIEIFKEYGRYKVLDVLHKDKTVWLDEYLDAVCKANACSGNQLRYDMGYLAPAHILAYNMQELSDLMRYLDKTYGFGNPRTTLVNISTNEPMMYLSDDIMMDFDAVGEPYGCTADDVRSAFTNVYDSMMGARFNMLHMLCMGNIMKDPILKMPLVMSLFDDEKMYELIEMYMQGRYNR